MLLFISLKRLRQQLKEHKRTIKNVSRVLPFTTVILLRPFTTWYPTSFHCRCYVLRPLKWADKQKGINKRQQWLSLLKNIALQSLSPRARLRNSLYFFCFSINVGTNLKASITSKQFHKQYFNANKGRNKNSMASVSEKEAVVVSVNRACRILFSTNSTKDIHAV